MSCDHRLISEHMCDYIEGTLSPATHAQCKRALDHCPHCRQTYEQALELYGLSSRWDQQPVPDWHRTRFAARPSARETSWLGWGTLATSCLAIFLVVFQLEVSTENGLLISFGGRQTEDRVREFLARELNAHRAETEALIETQLTDFAQQQNTANELMLTEWLERTRTERREDFEFILSAWESRRARDQRRIDERFDYLAERQIENNEYLNDLIETVELSSRGNL